MDPPVITSDADYRRYLAEVESSARQDPDPLSPAGRRLVSLACVLEQFERREFPLGSLSAATPPPSNDVIPDDGAR